MGVKTQVKTKAGSAMPRMPLWQGLAQRAVEFFLIAAIVFFIVRSVLGAMAPESLWVLIDAPPVTRSTTQVAAHITPYDFAVDPFNRAASTPEAVPASVGESAPETTLNLTLLGRRAAEDGTAILQTPDGGQGVFRIGDEIIAGVTLKAVNPEFIVLSREGQLERLTFERETQTKLMQPPQETSAPRATSAMQKVAANPRINPQDFISSIALNRVMENGRVTGFQIRSLSDRITLEDFGLKSGDLIVRIGNEDLTQGQPELSRLLANFSGASSARLTVKRGGELVTVNLGL